MSTSPEINPETAADEGLEQFLHRFDRAWAQGLKPRLDDYLPAGGVPLAVLHGLVRIDLQWRLTSGEPVLVESYLERFPPLTAERSVVLDLIAIELNVRRGVEPTATLEEYLARFPQYESQLREQFSAPVPPSQPEQHTFRQPHGKPIERLFSASPPDRLGCYELLEELGRGGMGIVRKGRDPVLGRDLAIKLLHQDHQTHPALVQRFTEEAQIGGQLQHPGIVPVYELGRSTREGPYITMKLVKGQTLAALLADRTNPSQDLSRYLGMFEQVGQTMAFAHSRGVIHRDLKPGNIMVGSFGEVQVMDWGLAKVLRWHGREREASAEETASVIATTRSCTTAPRVETEAETQPGEVLGTPAYMAPEQARGEVDRVDERADVFGLGAILCEILTGKPPFPGKKSEAMLLARQGTLADAFGRLDGCGADAELIVLAKRCLAHEPEHRLRDAGQVAEAVTTYQQSVRERLQQARLERGRAQLKAQEERKRRRLTVALTASVLLTALLGGGIWLWLWADRQARSARLQTEVHKALSTAETLRERARASRGPVAIALMAEAREQVQRAKTLVEAATGGEEDLADRVRQLHTELAQEEKDRRLIAALDEARLAQAQTDIRKSEFRSEEAIPLFRQAFVDYGLPPGEGHPGEVAERIRGSSAAVREALVATLEEWISLTGNLKNPGQEPHRKWLVAVMREASPERSRQQARLESLSERQRRLTLEELAAKADLSILPAAECLRLAKQLQLAKANASAVHLLRRAQARYPADFWINHTLGTALEEKPTLDRDEAVRFLSVAVALRPDSPGPLVNLGVALLDKGKLDEAIACFHKSIDLAPEYSAAHSGLGSALKRQGRWAAAVARYRKAISLDPGNALAYNLLGAAMHDKGKLDEAISCYRNAVRLDATRASFHCNLGIALKDKGQPDEAITCQRRAIALDPQLAIAHHNLGLALQDKGRLVAARVAIEKAIALEPGNAKAHCNLGSVQVASSQPEQAIASYRKAIALDPGFGMAYYGLGNAMKDQARWDEAIDCWRNAIALDPGYAQSHCNLGNGLAVKGLLDEAIPCWQKAIALDPGLPYPHISLGKAWLQQGKFAKAEASTRRALQLMSPEHPLRAGALQQRQQCRHLLRLETTLPEILAGKVQPASAAECGEYAHVCLLTKRYHASALLYARAFTTDGKLADNLQAGHRYNAACVAALAGVGLGKDARALDDKERARLRVQACQWLKADLTMWAERLKSGKPATVAQGQAVLLHWLKDADLDGVRLPKALANLPDAERLEWQQLWRDVGALLERMREKK